MNELMGKPLVSNSGMIPLPGQKTYNLCDMYRAPPDCFNTRLCCCLSRTRMWEASWNSAFHLVEPCNAQMNVDVWWQQWAPEQQSAEAGETPSPRWFNVTWRCSSASRILKLPLFVSDGFLSLRRLQSVWKWRFWTSRLMKTAFN